MNATDSTIETGSTLAAGMRRRFGREAIAPSPETGLGAAMVGRTRPDEAPPATGRGIAMVRRTRPEETKSDSSLVAAMKQRIGQAPAETKALADRMREQLQLVGPPAATANGGSR